MEKRFSVSLLYTKSESTSTGLKIDNSLRAMVVEANTDWEALGKTIFYFKEEMKKYNLSMHAIIEITPNPLTP